MMDRQEPHDFDAYDLGFGIQATERALRATFRAVFALSRDQGLSLDACQEGGMRALRVLAKGGGFHDAEHVLKFVRRCAVNWAKSQLRRRARERRLGNETESCVDPPILSDDEKAILREALERLPAHLRRVLEGTAAGYSGVELARRERRSPATISRRLSRARRTMRRLLA